MKKKNSSFFSDLPRLVQWIYVAIRTLTVFIQINAHFFPLLVMSINFSSFLLVLLLVFVTRRRSVSPFLTFYFFQHHWNKILLLMKKLQPIRDVRNAKEKEKWNGCRKKNSSNKPSNRWMKRSKKQKKNQTGSVFLFCQQLNFQIIYEFWFGLIRFGSHWLAHLRDTGW